MTKTATLRCRCRTPRVGVEPARGATATLTNIGGVEFPSERAIERIAGFAPESPEAIVQPTFKQLVVKRKGMTFVSDDGRLIYSR